MDITSPVNLWKDYNASALPLNISFLSPKDENGATVKEMYFDGYTTVDGRVRAFIKLLENPNAKGMILYLPDTNGGGDDPIIRTLYDYGYSVAVLDYLGKSEKLSNYTLFPRSLSYCNSRGLTQFMLVHDTSSSSRWYVWTCMARRAIRLLKENYTGNIFALGMGLGGSTVYKLAAFNDGLCACATLLNIIPKVDGEGNSIINYRASLENSAYASICKVPVFMAVASNDENGSYDKMSELASETASLSLFRTVERAFSSGIKKIYPDLDKFFDDCAKAENKYPQPKITASNSDGSLYLNITTKNYEMLTDEKKPQLFVSFCIDDPRYRNWMSLPLIGLGEGKFMAKINVCHDTKPIHAFVNMESSGGIVRSSPLFVIVPKTIGIAPRAGVGHRKIYDGSMGEDCWTSRDGGTIRLVQGPFDINGVTTDGKSLVTFKPGDPLFSVPPDTLLQLMLCGKQQTVTVTCRDKSNSYSSQVNLSDSENWQKFSLSHMNFKGANGPLAEWSQILTIEFYSEEEFIIGSVLWI
ncbi:MAG: hypothetical protein J1G01_03295 [Clostridiales bacterium]|nr:hypothetical protein [Clostridiales bacterium]